MLESTRSISNVLGFNAVAASDAVAAQTLAAAVGPRSAQVIAVLVMASTLGTLAAQSVGLPRYYFAPAEDGLFPKWLTRLTSRALTPANAVVTLGGGSMLFVILGGYSGLIGAYVLVAYPLGALALMGALVLRRRDRKSVV